MYQKIELQRNERLGKKMFWGTITILENETLVQGERKILDAMEMLRVILVSNLRKGDVISQKSTAQFAISLSTVNLKYAEKALLRVHEKFDVANKVKGSSIKIELFPY